MSGVRASIAPEDNILSQEDVPSGIAAIRAATESLQQVRNQFQPLYKYYFPEKTSAVTKRTFGLEAQPDFSKHRTELKRLRDEAWQLIETAKTSFERVGQSEAPLLLKKWAESAYRQVYFDGTVVILFEAYVRGMDERNPECAKYLSAMRDVGRESEQNLQQLRIRQTQVQSTR
jgi:hypothetical protein